MKNNIQKTTYPYKQLPDGSSLVIDVYQDKANKGTDKLPTIVFFHGGGWQGGHRDQFLHQSEILCTCGMICLTVEYRTMNAHGTPPKVAVSDAKSAMRWIHARADDLQIDLDRFACAGSSAGGHLAAASIMCPGFDDPADDLSVPIEASCLVLINPVSDNGPEDGYGYDRIKDDFPAISPAHNIRPDLPPTLILLGTADNLIPVSVCESFRNKMKEAGNECQLVTYEGAVHGFFNYNEEGNPFFDETLKETIRFLVDLGWPIRNAMR